MNQLSNPTKYIKPWYTALSRFFCLCLLKLYWNISGLLKFLFSRKLYIYNPGGTFKIIPLSTRGILLPQGEMQRDKMYRLLCFATLAANHSKLTFDKLLTISTVLILTLIMLKSKSKIYLGFPRRHLFYQTVGTFSHLFLAH